MLDEQEEEEEEVEEEGSAFPTSTLFEVWASLFEAEVEGLVEVEVRRSALLERANVGERLFVVGWNFGPTLYVIPVAFDFRLRSWRAFAIS